MFTDGEAHNAGGSCDSVKARKKENIDGVGGGGLNRGLAKYYFILNSGPPTISYKEYREKSDKLAGL